MRARNYIQKYRYTHNTICNNINANAHKVVSTIGAAAFLAAFVGFGLGMKGYEIYYGTSKNKDHNLNDLLSAAYGALIAGSITYITGTILNANNFYNTYKEFFNEEYAKGAKTCIYTLSAMQLIAVISLPLIATTTANHWWTASAVSISVIAAVYYCSKEHLNPNKKIIIPEKIPPHWQNKIAELQETKINSNCNII